MQRNVTARISEQLDFEETTGFQGFPEGFFFNVFCVGKGFFEDFRTLTNLPVLADLPKYKGSDNHLTVS